ncbi:MAG: hypothetical protein ACRDNS_07970 [Trebonia sp.]
MDSASEYVVVTFTCAVCNANTPLLYAHVLPDAGPDGLRGVEFTFPGRRLSTRDRLADPSYIDQRATGVPVDRYGPDRPVKIGPRGGISLGRCAQCGTRYPTKRAERLKAAALDAARQGVERVDVSPGGGVPS